MENVQELPSPFVHDIDLEDTREAVKGCAEFFEKEQDDLIVFNYRFCNTKTFPAPDTAPDARTMLLWKIKRECRGLIFNKETKKVVARRFHKFFNVGELDETAPEKINLNRPYVILTKYDGVLVTPVFTKGQVRFASKSGFADVTDVIEERFLSDKANDKYVSFSREWMEKNFTPIFEWCSPRNKIVLVYEQDQLVLTAIRHNHTGKYITYAEMEKSAVEHKIQVTEAHEGVVRSLDDFLKHLQAKQNIEGVVIKFEDDGTMYKIKTEWYFKRTHKEKQDFTVNSERNVWLLVLNQEIDDALAHLNDSRFSERVRIFEKELYEAIEVAAQKISRVATKHRALGRKEYYEAVNCDKDLPKNSAKIALKLHEPHKEAIDLVLEELKSNCKSPQLLEKSREMLGGVAFKE